MDWLSPREMEIAVRLAGATLAGMAIGLNRDLRGKPIGMRTLGLVSLSSAMLVLSGSVYGEILYAQDALSRVIQGILTGLGFLGAGVILRDQSRMEVQGLTTASTVWLAAALGVTAGLGAWTITLAGILIALMLLVIGKPIEVVLSRAFGSDARPEKKDD